MNLTSQNRCYNNAPDNTEKQQFEQFAKSRRVNHKLREEKNNKMVLITAYQT
jgi:hypothetical protein